MNCEPQKIGRFILELRKSHQMTQKELAERLNITDKAVSKWERGLSCPDISLLSSIAEIFGISTGELLNGERNPSGPEEAVEAGVSHALQYAGKAAQSRAASVRNICSMVFSLLLLTGAAVCIICDLAISGRLTWSLFPISSILFAWLVLFPVVKWGGRGVWGTLTALTLLIVPFLWVLDRLTPTDGMVLTIGVRMSVIGLLFVWAVFALFKRLKRRRRLAAALSLLLAIPVCLVINITLAELISEPVIDQWDVLSWLILAATAVVLLFLDCASRKSGPDAFP